MNCRRVQRELSEWLAGRSPRAAFIDAHLASCARCRDIAAQLRVVVSTARDLPGWDAPQGLFERASAAAALPAARTMPLWLRRSLSRWPLVAASSAVAVAVIVAVWMRTPRPVQRSVRPAISAADEALLASAKREFERAEAHYRKAIRQLRRVALDDSASWAPGRRRAYLREMAIIEEAVARCRNTARVAPADPAAQELLFAAYRRQLGMMQDAILGGGAVVLESESGE